MQHRAAKLVDGFYHMSYFRKLRKTESTIVESIIYRRARGDMIEIFKHFHSYEIVSYMKIVDLETVLVENATTSWYRKHPKMAWEDSRQILSTSEQAKPGMSSEKKSYMPSLSTHLKTKLDEAILDLPIKFYEHEQFIEA